MDTYLVATMGYNGSNDHSFSSISLASLGWLYTVEITEIVIPDDEDVNIYETGGVVNYVYTEPLKQTPPRKKFKIKVSVVINEKLYTEEKFIKRIEKPKVKDLDISIVEENTPKIKIKIL